MPILQVITIDCITYSISTGITFAQIYVRRASLCLLFLMCVSLTALPVYAKARWAVLIGNVCIINNVPHKKAASKY